VASTSKPVKPRSRTAVKRDPQPQLSDLIKYGVKVRDFAYESVLPPVRTVYRQPRQVQPSVPRQLRREDTEPLEDFSQSQPWSQQSNLGRESTEPAIDPEIVASQPRREPGYCNLEDFDGEIEALINSQNRGSPAPVSSQTPGNYISTPTVTPNGSLKWESTAPVALQSTPRLPSRQPSRLQQEISFTFSSSPLTPCPPTPTRQSSLMFTSIKRSPSMASLTQPPAKRRTIPNDTSMQISLPPTPRYFLRKRNNTSTTSTAKPSKRLRPSHSISSPALRRSVSIQSNQARKKSKSEHNSPSSRQRAGPAATLGKRRRS